MGLKTKVTPKGVTTEQTDGNDVFEVNTRLRPGTRNFTETTGNVNLGLTGSRPVNVFEASSGDITIELPEVTANNLGLEYTIINADISNNLVLTSSVAAQEIDSSGTSFTVGEEAATIVAVSSSLDGYSWIVTSLKA